MSEHYRIATEAFRDTLQIEASATTDFFAAGGTSLQAAKMLRGLYENGVRPKLGVFFTDPTPVGLARQLAGEV